MNKFELKIGDLCYDDTYCNKNNKVIYLGSTVGTQPVLCSLNRIKEGDFSIFYSSFEGLHDVFGHIDLCDIISKHIDI